MDLVNGNHSLRRHAKVVIVCLASEAAPAADLISKYAPLGWRDDGEIVLVPIADKYRRYGPQIEERISQAAPPGAATRVLTLQQISRQTKKLSRDGRTDERVLSLKVLNRTLPEILRQSDADWLSHSTRTISSWQHSKITPEHVAAWLRQFEILGSRRLIGERLLRGLDYWSAPRWTEALALEATRLADFDYVCINRDQAGKSGDALSNLISKQIKSVGSSTPVEDFYYTLENTPSGSRVLFVEDGLFTATEALSLLNSLLGNVPNGRKPKVPALSHPDKLRSQKIHMLFPIATSLGVNRLRDFIRQHNFHNITLEVPEPGFREVFTTEGQSAFEDGTFFASERNCPANPAEHVLIEAFQNPRLWTTDEERQAGICFCREIGDQLFRRYLKYANYVWPEVKIQACALGMFGLGLNLAFTHSVPKAALPLLWMGGLIEFEGKKRNWLPLFLNAL